MNSIVRREIADAPLTRPICDHTRNVPSIRGSPSLNPVTRQPPSSNTAIPNSSSDKIRQFADYHYYGVCKESKTVATIVIGRRGSLAWALRKRSESLSSFWLLAY